MDLGINRVINAHDIPTISGISVVEGPRQSQLVMPQFATPIVPSVEDKYLSIQEEFTL